MHAASVHFAINVALHVLLLTVITALALPESRPMMRPEAQNNSKLQEITQHTSRLRSPPSSADTWLGAGGVSWAIS